MRATPTPHLSFPQYYDDPRPRASDSGEESPMRDYLTASDFEGLSGDGLVEACLACSARFSPMFAAFATLVCPERLVRDSIPMEPHDRSVPRVLTETGLYENGLPNSSGILDRTPDSL